MPSHDSLYLLRNVLTAPRLMYLLRTAPCTGSPALPAFDAVLRESLSTTLNIDLDDDRWTRALLPVRWGGLGIRIVVSLAPSAYLASAANTVELTSSLLPTRLRDVVDSGIAIAMSTWTKLASSSTIVSADPSPPVTVVVRYRPICNFIRLMTLLIAPDYWRHVLLDPATGSVHYLCRALGSRWIMPQSASLSDCVLVLQSFVHTNAFAGQWSLWMDTMVSPAVTALDVIHDIMK